MTLPEGVTSYNFTPSGFWNSLYSICYNNIIPSGFYRRA